MVSAFAPSLFLGTDIHRLAISRASSSNVARRSPCAILSRPSPVVQPPARARHIRTRRSRNYRDAAPVATPPSRKLRKRTSTKRPVPCPSPGFESATETPTAIPLKVTGKIPSWASGELTRVGPSVFEASAADGSKLCFSWFDGLPFLHQFHIQDDGQVTYRSKHLARHIERAVASVPSKDYAAVMVGTVVDPCKSIFEKVFTMFRPQTKDPQTPSAPPYPVGVAVERRGRTSGMTITSDAASYLHVDEETLEPAQFVSYESVGAHGDLACAHGVYDQDEDAYYNVMTSVKLPRGPLRIVKMLGDKAETFCTIPNVPSSYMHSFGMTEKYFALVMTPTRLSGFMILRDRNLLNAAKFMPSEETQIFVVERATGKHVATYKAPAFFFFHVVNAFDLGDDLVVDICRYDDMEVFDKFSLDILKNMSAKQFPKSRATRITLSDVARPKESYNGRHARKACIRTIADIHIDLPRINEKQAHREYRYTYGVSHGEHHVMGALVKIDMLSGDTLRYGSYGRYPSEPIFVPRPAPDGATDEDDGVVMFIELDVRGQHPKSALVVLDARTMTEIARSETPDRKVVPFGFHGNFHSTTTSQ